MWSLNSDYRHVRIPVNGRSVRAIAAGGDLWFSRCGLTELYCTTRQNISIHISNLQRRMGHEWIVKRFPTFRTEGRRTLRRNQQHFGLSITHAVALLSRRFDEFNQVAEFAKAIGIEVGQYKVLPNQQREFGNMLTTAIDGLAIVEQQRPVLSYFVDFYLPEFLLVVEYDETHHDHPMNQQLDYERQAAIESELGATFVRVREGEELRGINLVFQHILGQLQAAS